MEFFETGQEIANLSLGRLATTVIFLRRGNDQIDNGWETTTAAPALRHRVIDLARNNQLPTVFIKELVDDLLDVLVRNEIATANQHVGSVRQT